MKNQFNTIKEYVESGYFVLVKDVEDNFMTFTIFTTYNQDLDWIYSNDWNSSVLEAKSDLELNCSPRSKDKVNTLDLEIVELFRPNDLFPSKRFKVGDKVQLKEDMSRYMAGEPLTIYEVSSSGNQYKLKRANGYVSLIWMDEQYIYPRIEKQEEEKKPEDIIGEASKKALEDAGYTITKK